MRKGFLIYEEMQKYLVIYGEADCHICLCNRSLLFLIYEENLLFFFNSVGFSLEIHVLVLSVHGIRIALMGLDLKGNDSANSSFLKGCKQLFSSFQFKYKFIGGTGSRLRVFCQGTTIHTENHSFAVVGQWNGSIQHTHSS
jgi:hypothetical protein